MTTQYDDRPHPVPPFAFLRYKENWFFIVMDEQSDIFGVIHIVSEPGFERIRFACHLCVEGELYKYGSEVPFPIDYAMAQEISDGKLSVRFAVVHEDMTVTLRNDEIDLELNFLKKAPLFNFEDYDFANPDKLPLSEVMNLGTGQQFVHQQQGMKVNGSVTIKVGPKRGTTIQISGLGYRDHSRSVRSDNLVLQHSWNGLHIGDKVFGAVSVTGLVRPELSASCGYVYDATHGLRSLRDVKINFIGELSIGVPETVELLLTDVCDRPFTIIADLRNRFANVPLHSEKPGAVPYVYDIVENFAPIQLAETGETGIGLIEVGWSTPNS